MSLMRASVITRAVVPCLLVPQLALAQVERSPAQAQAVDPGAAWSTVTTITREKLAVLTVDGKWHEGHLRIVVDDTISLDTGRTFPREQVWQVWQAGKPGGAKPGFLAGLAVGVALPIVAYATQGDCANPNSGCAKDGYFSGGAAAGSSILLGIGFGALGAWLGHHFGGPGRQPRLLYSAPTRRNPPSSGPSSR
jgi:hypothetical protein